MATTSDPDALGAVWAADYLHSYGFPPGELPAEPFLFLPSVQATLPMPLKDFCNALEVALKLIKEQEMQAPPKPAPGPPPSPVTRFSATDRPRRVERPDRLD